MNFAFAGGASEYWVPSWTRWLFIFFLFAALIAMIADSTIPDTVAQYHHAEARYEELHFDDAKVSFQIPTEGSTTVYLHSGEKIHLPDLLDARSGYKALLKDTLHADDKIDKAKGRYELYVNGQIAIDDKSVSLYVGRDGVSWYVNRVLFVLIILLIFSAISTWAYVTARYERRPLFVDGYSFTVCPLCSQNRGVNSALDRGVLRASKLHDGMSGQVRCIDCHSHFYQLKTVTFAASHLNVIIGDLPASELGPLAIEDGNPVIPVVPVVVLALKFTNTDWPVRDASKDWGIARSVVETTWVCPFCSGDCSDAKIVGKGGKSAMTCTQCGQEIEVEVMKEYDSDISIVVQKNSGLALVNSEVLYVGIGAFKGGEDGRQKQARLR